METDNSVDKAGRNPAFIFLVSGLNKIIILGNMEKSEKPKKKRGFFQPGNNYGEATRFQPGNKLGGRKPDRVAAILNKAITPRNAAQLNLTRDEVEEWEGKLISLTLDDIKKICKESETPAYVVAVAMAIISDLKNGRTMTVDKLRDRQFGKVAEKVELTGKDGEELFKGVEISEEQKDRLRQILGEQK